jgi:hypothetical protein
MTSAELDQPLLTTLYQWDKSLHILYLPLQTQLQHFDRQILIALLVPLLLSLCV